MSTEQPSTVTPERRKFLKSTGTAAVAAAIAGCTGGGGDGGGDGGGGDGGGDGGDGGGGATTTAGLPTFENQAGVKVGANFEAIKELAKEEDAATAYATIDRGPFQTWIEGFKKKYDNVDINHVTGGSEKLVSRYDTEYETGNVQSSLVIMGSKIKRLWQNDQVMELGPDIMPSWKEMPKKFKDTERNNWLAVRQLMGSMHYNEDMVNPDQINVNNWMDAVTRSAWQDGKIGWDPTPNMFLMSWLWNNVGEKFFDRLHDATPRWVDSHTDLARLCGAGEFPVCFTYTHKMGRFGNKLPLNYFKFDPMPSVISPGVINNKAPQPNTALLFFNWLTSVEGQNLLGTTQYIPIHPKAEYKGYPGVYPSDEYEVDIIPLDTNLDKIRKGWENKLGDLISPSDTD